MPLENGGGAGAFTARALKEIAPFQSEAAFRAADWDWPRSLPHPAIFGRTALRSLARLKQGNFQRRSRPPCDWHGGKAATLGAAPGVAPCCLCAAWRALPCGSPRHLTNRDVSRFRRGQFRRGRGLPGEFACRPPLSRAGPFTPSDSADADPILGSERSGTAPDWIG